MKEYIKPYIEDEEIEIEDICNASNGLGEKTVTDDFTDDGSDNSIWPW